MLNIPPQDVANAHFDIILIGSGFGAAFFLHELMQRRAGRILVLEWGDHHRHDWQLENRANSAISNAATFGSNSKKPWDYTIGLGGGTNCWYGQTPRMHPSDFKMKSLYGVGQDWPIDYDDLEEAYCDAEAIMSISGDPDMGQIMPMSRPFPQPPHRMSHPDRIMKAAQPHQHFAMPTARARQATQTRNACCASNRCRICPVDAKFTANNGLMHLFDAPEVSVVLGAEVRRLGYTGNSVQSVSFQANGHSYTVTGDLFVLGANAIQSPAILKRSGLGEGVVGLGLHEAYGADFEVFLDGVENFDGSTITTGLNFGLYDGAHRAEHGAALVYFENRWPHGMRLEAGRMRETLPIAIVTEDLLEDHNRVTLDDNENAFVEYAGPSDYALKGMREAVRKLPDLLSPLPVEEIFDKGVRGTESHLKGTLRMGLDPSTSVVDRNLLHHRLRNLVIVGTSTFSSSSCANPSLTAAALSLRAARAIL